MTQIKKLATPRRVKTGVVRPVNPFLDTELFTRMRDYTDRDAIFAKEIKAIAESGAGKQAPDPRFAPSLQTILGVVKKGLTLAQMFERIVAGTERGLWEPWMEAYGFELRSADYAKTGPRNAALALDLRAGSKANFLFTKAGVANWRSLVVQDCGGLRIENMNDNTLFTAYAFFYLDPAA